MPQEKIGNPSGHNLLQKLLASGSISLLTLIAACSPSGDGQPAVPSEKPTADAPADPTAFPSPDVSESTTAKPEPTVTSMPNPDDLPTGINTFEPADTETPGDQVDTETPGDTVADVPEIRDWNIAPDTVDRLQSAETNLDKWAIIKEVVYSNNEPGSYVKDRDLEGRDIEPMFNRTAIELATMADIAQDPNVEGGDIIASTWAELAIIDDDTREYFLDINSNLREMYTTSDQETVDMIVELQKEDPEFHLMPKILHSSDGVSAFHDNKTGTDYTGMTFTSAYEAPKPYGIGGVVTMTVVLDFGNYATQILRVYPESTSGGWEIAFNTGETPQKVADLPGVIEHLNS